MPDIIENQKYKTIAILEQEGIEKLKKAIEEYKTFCTMKPAKK